VLLQLVILPINAWSYQIFVILVRKYC